MIKHYLKVAFRNLMKYKTQSLVSIIGLAVGFTCFALSVLWIRYEMTYDTFHNGATVSIWYVRIILIPLVVHPMLLLTLWQTIYRRKCRR